MVDFDDCPPKTGDDEWRGEDFVAADDADRADAYRARTGVRMQTSGMLPVNSNNIKKAGGTKGGRKGGKRGC